MVNIRLVAEDSKALHSAIKTMDEKFYANINARKVVHRDIEVICQDNIAKIDVNMSFVFPSFKIPAYYVLALSVTIGLFVGLLRGQLFFMPALITGGLGFMFLRLPDVMQQPKVIFLMFKKGLRKLGYKGYVNFIGGST
jgi:hypothetical protein